MVRKNGLEKPLHPYQIIAWCFVILFALGFYLFYGIFLPFPFDAISCAIFGMLLLVTSILGLTGSICLLTVFERSESEYLLLVTAKDPKDPNVDIRRRRANLSFIVPPGVHVIDERGYCCLCQVVVGEKSKHCRYCDKCVSVFDHHCIWLNNCVGRSNYRFFFMYITLMFLSTLYILAIGCVLIGEFAVNPDRIAGKLAVLYFPEFPKFLYVALVSLFVFLDLPAVFLLGHLFFFHVNLAFIKKTTTYDYIMTQRRNKETREAMKNVDKALKDVPTLSSRRRTGRCICCGASKVFPSESDLSKTDTTGPVHILHVRKRTQWHDTRSFQEKDTDCCKRCSCDSQCCKTRARAVSLPRVTVQSPSVPSLVSQVTQPVRPSSSPKDDDFISVSKTSLGGNAGQPAVLPLPIRTPFQPDSPSAH